LNRLSSASAADQSFQQTNVYDPFGNITGTSGTVSFPAAGVPNNRITASNYQYDNAGNLTQADPGVLIAYAYDAEGRLNNYNNSAAIYTYDGASNRVRKDVGSDWTEYIYWQQQPIAEKHADGTWSDYIFANGQRIARADSYDTRWHMSGVNADSCSEQYFSLGWADTNAYTHVIQQGDILNFRQFSGGPGVLGGLALYFSNDFISYFDPVYDQDGEDIGADLITEQWHYRTFDLSPYAGFTVQWVRMINTGGAPPGEFDLYFNDIAITSPDGSVLPIFSKASEFGMDGGIDGPPECVSDFAVVDETSASAGDALLPENTTTYYHGDQLGSARMLTAGGGWAVWSEGYTPYGQQIYTPQVSPPNYYKFTGKERDSESGNDYFGARYYASSMGRFMSPDQPFYSGQLDNPQDLNLYSYVHNNPLSKTDPDGHNVLVCADGADSCLNYTDQGYQNLLAAQNGQQGINLPTGSMPNGDITCGGQTCGTANFFEPGAQDETGDELTGIAGGMAGDFALGKIGSFIEGLFGRGAGEAAGNLSGNLAGNAGKTTVQDILQGATSEGGSRANIFSKPGGIVQATKDFNALDGNAVKAGNVLIKDLSDGQGRAVLRTDPSTFGGGGAGRPTMEIQPAGGGYAQTKIRYN
jgi:RHS repeat-associated protein